MKTKISSLALALTFITATAQAQEYVLIDKEKDIDKGFWVVHNTDIGLKDTNFRIQNRVLTGGKEEGSQLLSITSGNFNIYLSPTRGMGILSVEGDGIRLGWDAPVKGVINPKFIDLESRDGLGWLDGFDEMLVRCGFEWSGHPVKADGKIYSLHGRVQNIPVSKLLVNIEDKPPYTLTIKGLIEEKSDNDKNLETWTSLTYVPGTKEFTIHDVVTNKGKVTSDYQIIYHSNFGTPILEEGAKFVAPVKEISPFNDYAKGGLKTWETYSGPINDASEMVFNIYPYAKNDGQTQVMLTDKNGDKAVGIAYNIKQLPVFSLWKSFDPIKQGYVTGLEPGTSFAYPVTIEREQKRVRQLEPGQSTEFTLTYSLLSNKEAVSKYADQIKAIQDNRKTDIVETPMAQE